MATDYYLSCYPVNNLCVWTKKNQSYKLASMTLAQRIAERMLSLGETQESLAKKSGVSQTTIYKLVSGKAKQTRKLVAIAKALKCSPAWLSDGEGPMQDRPTDPASLPGWANVRSGPDVVGLIPLISWVQAGAFCTAINMLEPGDAERWIPTLKQYGPHAYALRVQGDSMVSPYPGARSYPPGFILFVDPDRAITNGCRVIAKLPDTDEATFKVYTEDSGKRYLKPLNPQYPTTEMTEAMALCGVVVGGFWEE